MTHHDIHLKERFPFLGEEDRDPVLSLYLPYNATPTETKRPAIMVCPGGGYGFVSSREAEPIALQFLTEGYYVFVLTYSCAPHRFPVQLREVAAAMELIYENAEQWNVDTDRIAIIGFSAGGHLAAHYSNSFDCEEVRSVFPDSKPVQASILCYPVITAQEGQCHRGSFNNLVGHFPLTAEEDKKFSCHNLVTDHTPPAFVWHTAEDNSVPVISSLLYAQAMSEHKRPFALHVYPYGCHGLSTADEQTNAPLSPSVQLVADWLPAAKKWLKITL